MELIGMKTSILMAFLLIFISCGTKRALPELSGSTYYPVIGVNAKFKYADSDAFVIHKDISKQVENHNKIYSVREIQYSWGRKVETFYRVEDGNILYYDDKSGTESMIMPKNPKVGFKWISADNAWEYEIVELNAELETPQKKYSNLMVMRAIQLKDRDQEKLKEYLNYYQANLGKVASIGNGKLMTYRIH